MNKIVQGQHKLFNPRNSGRDEAVSLKVRARREKSGLNCMEKGSALDKKEEEPT